MQAPSPGFRGLTLGGFADELASANPVPGGGSASAVVAGLGASLVAMVATLSQNRPKYAQHAALHELAIPAAQRIGERFFALADQDAEAYAACAIALKLPRATDEEKAERDAQVRESARVAAEVPLECLAQCLDLLTLAEALAGRVNVNASSDLHVAALLTEAAGRGAAANVLVNLPLVGPGPWSTAMEARVTDMLGDVRRLAATTSAIVESGEARAPLEELPQVKAASVTPAARS